MLSGIVDIDRTAPVSLPDQVYRQVRQAVKDGRLKPSQRLPSSRTLAIELNVSRNVIISAYELLKCEMIIDVRAGAVPVIRPVATWDRGDKRSALAPPPSLSSRGNRLCRDVGADATPIGAILTPGKPAPELFPRDLWARTLRRACRNATLDDWDGRYSAGLPALKSALAHYLADVRGVRAEPAQVLITSSTQSALSLVAQSLANPGDRAWIENPGYLGARLALQHAGLRLDAMPIDDEGALPPSPPRTKTPKLIYLTPSHQYPLGHTMSLARRLAFIKAARRMGALILEDDYDSEFLFGDRPIAAMQGLSSDTEVLYLGGFSKSLLPGIRVGYMIAPPGLSDHLSNGIQNMGIGASAPIQAALADLISSGRYRIHLRQARNIYRDRSLALSTALQSALGDRAEIIPPSGGVQMAIRFHDPIDDVRLVARLNDCNIGVVPISTMYLESPSPGLIIGFAQIKEKTILQGVKTICAMLE